MKDLKYYMSLHYPISLIQRDHGGFFATHPDLSGCMAQGRTAEEAIANLRDSREVWIEARLRGGYDVPEPVAEELSGRFSLRIRPRLHGALAQAAAREGISLNQLVTNILTEYSGGRSVTEAFPDEMKEMVREAVREVVPDEVREAVRGAVRDEMDELAKARTPVTLQTAMPAALAQRRPGAPPWPSTARDTTQEFLTQMRRQGIN